MFIAMLGLLGYSNRYWATVAMTYNTEVLVESVIQQYDIPHYTEK